MTDFWCASVQVAFHIYLKYLLLFIHALFQMQKDTNFRFKSTEVNLLSCLICVSDKMADSALWLVRSPVNQAVCKDDSYEAVLYTELKT